MSPRVRRALRYAAPYGIVFAIMRIVFRLARHAAARDALIDAGLIGAWMFVLAFGTKFFFPSFGERRPRPNSN